MVIKITEMKVTLKTTTMNTSLVKDDYYIFRYLKKNNSKKNSRKFYEELQKDTIILYYLSVKLYPPLFPPRTLTLLQI